jgi:dipeptidyl aminopeptidase/acylaminoacyl peptidase
VQPKGKSKMTLQGTLHYPANYEPGKKYPMVVYLYEKLSDGLHRFQNPSERDYYNGTALTQNGYFYFQPDIVFQPGEPGVSVVECVEAAVKAVIAKGAVDAAKVCDVPLHALKGVRRCRLRRRHLEPHQQLRQPPLFLRHCRDRPY